MGNKFVLGLDLGVSSVGYALVKEGSDNQESEIIKMGVRIVNSDPDFHGKFEKGQAASKNASRRQKRQIRRGYQRYKLRRNQLINVLEDHNLMPGFALRFEKSKLDLLRLRAKAATEQISLEEFGRVCMLLLRKRGFLSNRKANAEESETDFKQKLAERHAELGQKTIGQFLYSKVSENPDFSTKGLVFLRQAYQIEFDQIWQTQRQFYPHILTGGPEAKSRDSLYFKLAVETLFYQRPLKSQKHLIGFCRYETQKRVAHSFSPFYQQFRIWKQINDCVLTFPDGSMRHFSNDERGILFLELNNPNSAIVPKTGIVKPSKIFQLLGLDKKTQLNFADGINANKLHLKLNSAFQKVGLVVAPTFWDLDWRESENPGPSYLFWHTIYSIEEEKSIAQTLVDQARKRYGLTISTEIAEGLAANLTFNSDYGSISVRSIRKMMPFLEEGMTEYDAALAAGYERKEVQAQYDKLPRIEPNALRNPVVEQILNQMVSVVNDLMERTGIKPDEIRVEMARELKMNAKRRAAAIQANQKGLKEAQEARKAIEGAGNSRASTRDVLRYKLWKETGMVCLYSGKTIPFSDLFNGMTEIEHVIPRSRLFNNTRSNLILAYRKENEEKGQQTAIDFMEGKGPAAVQQYIDSVSRLFEQKLISKAKKDFLMMRGTDIPNDFVDHQLRNTQYIARAAVNHLAGLVGEKNVMTSTGQITDYLRERWELIDVLKEINLPYYEAANLVTREQKQKNDGTVQEVNWLESFTKRSDHRHHALDALITAFTSRALVHRLNNLNQYVDGQAELKHRNIIAPPPIPHFRALVKDHLQGILVSFKKPKSKAISPKMILKYPGQRKKSNEKIKGLVPRGSLHEETVLGKIKVYEKVPLNVRFYRFEDVVDKDLKDYLLNLKAQAESAQKKAFKAPVEWRGKTLSEVVCWKWMFTKRTAVQTLTAKQIKDKIVDAAIGKLILERFKSVQEDEKKFQKSILEHPLIFNGKTVQRITVFDEGSLMPVRQGFAYSKNNHHAIIYKDEQGNLRDEVLSLSEVVERSTRAFLETGIIPKPIQPKPAQGEEVVMTLQINDLVVIGLEKEKLESILKSGQHSLLAMHLFRVQKMSKGYYVFRQCYQTDIQLTAQFAFRRIQKPLKQFSSVTRVRLSPAGYFMETLP
jgi:CRISPR-associated endonuclease Csn1